MTIDALLPFYRWELALHIIAFTAWMASLLYLPRLYVYHCEVAAGSAESARFKVMDFGDPADFDPRRGRLACGLVVDEIRQRDPDERVSRRVFQMA
jgi:hypothetical protein